MAKRAPAGAPAWLITFADLMSLLVAFFVLIISFSVPDVQKLKIIAGSLRNAFGISLSATVTGMIELDGEPHFKFARDLVPFRLEDVVGPIPDRGDEITRLAAREEYWARVLEAEEEGAPHDESEARQLDQLERELREAIRAVPELAALADNLHFDHAPEGLRIQLLDQARMSMFPLGSAQMYDPTRRLLGEVVRAITALPHQIAIAGHTDSVAFRRRDGYDNWSLSLARADATRRVILEAGLPPARLATVSGKADTDHLYPDDPTDPRNRRISIILLREPPPEAQ
jgi:chemotaxis protein MotB